MVYIYRLTMEKQLTDRPVLNPEAARRNEKQEAEKEGKRRSFEQSIISEEVIDISEDLESAMDYVLEVDSPNCPKSGQTFDSTDEIDDKKTNGLCWIRAIERDMLTLRKMYEKKFGGDERKNHEESHVLAITGFGRCYYDAISLLMDSNTRTVLEYLSVIEYHDEDKFVLRVQKVISILSCCSEQLLQGIEYHYSQTREFQGSSVHCMSHFQNCVVPPKTDRTIYDGTRKVSLYLSADGCPADRPQLDIFSNSRFGGKMKCRTSINSCENVWLSWRKPQTRFAEHSPNFYPCWKISSYHTRRWPTKVCRFFWTSMNVYLGRTTTKQYCASLCCSPSSWLKSDEPSAIKLTHDS